MNKPIPPLRELYRMEAIAFLKGDSQTLQLLRWLIQTLIRLQRFKNQGIEE